MIKNKVGPYKSYFMLILFKFDKKMSLIIMFKRKYVNFN